MTIEVTQIISENLPSPCFTSISVGYSIHTTYWFPSSWTASSSMFNLNTSAIFIFLVHSLVCKQFSIYDIFVDSRKRKQPLPSLCFTSIFVSSVVHTTHWSVMAWATWSSVFDPYTSANIWSRYLPFLFKWLPKITFPCLCSNFLCLKLLWWFNILDKHLVWCNGSLTLFVLHTHSSKSSC